MRVGAFTICCAVAAAAMAIAAMPASAAATSGPPRTIHGAPRTVAPTTPSSSGTWQWQSPSPSGAPLFAVTCPTIGICFAAGTFGVIEKTTDRGKTWTAQNSGVTDLITGISCFNDVNCLAVDVNGDGLNTADGGTTWKAVSVTGGIPLNAISCAYEDPTKYPEECMAAGDGGVVYRTVDFGVTWTKLSTGTTANLYGISCWAWSRCPVAGASGTILMPVNDGASWGVVNSTVSVDLYAISCPYSGEPVSDPPCLAVGQTGTAVTGTDVDSTWSATQIPGAIPGAPSPAMLGVNCQAGCIVTGADGFMYSTPSPDWNATLLQYTQPWLASSSGAAGAMRAISCTGLNSSGQVFLAYQCMAVGDYSTVIGTTNHGSAWNPRPAGEFHPYGPIACASTTACVAISIPPYAPNSHTTCDPNGQCYFTSPPGAIAHTSNGGVTWPIVPLPGNPNITAMACPSAAECIGVGNPGFCQSTTVACSVAIETTDGGATWNTISTGQGASLWSIACPSTTTCFASGDGGAVISTTDAGAHWTALTTGTTQTVDSISCPTATTCVGSLGVFNIGPQAGATISTADGGVTWHKTALTGAWNGVDCPIATACYLIGSGPTLPMNTVMFSTDGGATWIDRSPPQNTYTSLYGISCPAASTCYLLGQGPYDLTTDGGLHWTPTGNGSYPGFSFVSCPSASTCFGAGANGVLSETTNSAASWTPMTPYTFTPTRTDVNDVRCPSSTVCYAVSTNHLASGGFVLESVDSGTDWFPVYSNPNFSPGSISCPSTSTCFATGLNQGNGNQSLVVSTADSGVTWTVDTPINQALSAIACPSTTMCVASSTSSNSVLVTSNAGATWSTFGTPATLGDLSCPSTAVCYSSSSVPAAGSVWKSTDGGQTWNLNFNVGSDPNAGSVQPFAAIDCPNVTTCYAVGAGGLLATTTDGVNWRTDAPLTAADFNDVSCANAGTCFAISPYFVAHTSDFGGTWDQQVAATTADVYRAIACPTTTLCVGVGDSGLVGVTTVGGQEWTLAFPLQTTNTVMSLSCPDANNCYGAAFDTIVMSHDGGSSWTQHTFTNSDQLLGMSCPSTSSCFAVGWPGAIYRTTDSGVTWTSEVNVLSGSDETLESVSCTSTTSCVAVGTDGNVLTTADGLTWTRSTQAIQAFGGVACPSAGSCVAVGTGGMAYVLSAGSWHAATTGVTATLDAVSCPSPLVCFATGHGGTVIVSRNGGLNWTSESSVTTATLFGVSCPFTTVCLAAGGGGTLAYTRDGINWGTELSPTPAQLRTVVLTASDQAWIAGAGGSIVEDASAIPVPCQSATLTPSAPTPAATGASITLTGSSTACPDPQYRFWVRSPGGTWKIVQDYSPTNTFAWQSPATGTPGTYGLEVDARDASSTASYDVVQSTTYVLNPCSAATLAAGPASPQTAGTAETLTAGSTCPGTPTYRFWIRNPGGTWGIVQDYGTGNTYAWNTSGKPAGTYYLEVDVRNQGATASYEATHLISFALSSIACASVTLNANPTSPGPTGSPVTFTANATGCPNPLYRYWVAPPGGAWSILQNYSPTPTFSWTGTPGINRIEVDVKDASSSAAYDAVMGQTYTLAGCTAANFTTDKPSPQLTGTTSVTLTATSTCPGTPDYRFWIKAPGGSWTVVQNYSPTATLTWNTSTLPAGTYNLEVDVRNHGSTASYEAVHNSTFTLSGCINASLTPDKTSPQPAGTTIVLTGSATCTGTPQYRFWIRAPGGAWTIVQDYSPTSTFSWNTTGQPAATYTLEVDVRNGGSSVAYETLANATFVLN